MKKCIIFDCDGVLVDSEMIAHRIDAKVLTQWGYPLSVEESIKRFTGVSTKTIQHTIFKEKGIKIPLYIFEHIQRMLLQAFQKELTPLLLPLFSSDFMKNLDLCIASSSSKERVLMSLKITHQKTFFEEKNIFTADQVHYGKPAPDLFYMPQSRWGMLSKTALSLKIVWQASKPHVQLTCLLLDF